MIGLGALWGKIQGWAAIVGVALLGLAAAYWRIREDGKNAVRSEQEKRRLESMQQRKEIDDEVDQMGAADVDANFTRWMRDDDKR